MPYAQYTKVSALDTRSEIERMLAKAGATSFANATEDGRAMVQFKMKERIIRFQLPLPKIPDRGTTKERNQAEQKIRQKWRGLLLTIKAKLESIESDIEHFEVAFMAQIVMPGNVTVADMALPAISEAYKSGKAPAMLLEWNN